MPKKQPKPTTGTIAPKLTKKQMEVMEKITPSSGIAGRRSTFVAPPNPGKMPKVRHERKVD